MNSTNYPINKRIKAYTFCSLFFITIFSFPYISNAQVFNADSLQKSIMQSVQGYMHESDSITALFDTSGKPYYSPVNLNKILEGVNKQIAAAKSASDINGLGKGYRNLSTIDSIRGNYKGAYENYKLYTIYRDSLAKKDLERKELQAKMQREFDRKQTQQQLEKAKQDRANAIRQIFLIAILLVFITVATTSFIAYKREQRAKKLLNSQKTEVESTLSELRSTQSQLIQSEKMASLGELTAGIAHEIQNPLNFVNNFSEVNNELIDEMSNENDMNEVKTIAKDIKQNNEKIAFHGRRADAIVKGMLQHSRQSSGAKEPTDINALCDEYLRLSYHGLRAKDKSFNADFKTGFDEGIGKINIVSQDIGRMLLNLFNNAFYAVNEKQKNNNQNYKPTVSVQTKKLNDKVEVIISDNGNGIPKNIIGKIFQPFFTTKPTGQGTGLGLSLAYDIVTKEHNGTMQVESKEGDGTTFTIQLSLA